MNDYINRWKNTVAQHNVKLQNLRSSSREAKPQRSTSARRAILRRETAGDETPPEFNDDLQEVLSSTVRDSPGRRTLRRTVPDDLDTPPSPRRESPMKENKDTEGLGPLDIALGKLEAVMGEKLPKGKRKARLKTILAAFQTDLQEERDQLVSQTRKLREQAEKAKNRQETTSKVMGDLESKLYDCERSKVELRKEKEKLSQRVQELERQQSAQLMSQEMWAMLKESHQAMQLQSHELHDAMQQQKRMFDSERAIWTNELADLRHKLDTLRYGPQQGGSMLGGSPKDSLATRSGALQQSRRAKESRRENTIIESPYLVADEEDEVKDSLFGKGGPLD